MIDKEMVELAVRLHGHLAPGLALGLRMSQIAMDRLGVSRGNKKLIGISETSRCLADAMQVYTGCTLGHGNAFIEDYGKLAMTIADTKTGRGIRVSLKNNACDLSPLMEQWMMRQGRLNRAQEEELGFQLMEMDERYLSVQDVEINKAQNFESTRIVECLQCGDLVPEALSELIDGNIICRVCSCQGYCRVI